MLPAGLPVPIPAVIPVTDVAMILVPEAPRIIPAAKPVQLSADQSVVTAIRHAQAAVRLIPEVLWDITNAAAPAGLATPLVPQGHRPLTPAVAADQPRMNAGPGLVIILMNHVTPIIILVHQGISRVRAVPDIPKPIRRQNPVPAGLPRVLAINARRIMIRMNVKPVIINQERFPEQVGVIVTEVVLMMQQSIFGAETNILVQPTEDMRNIFIRIIITLPVRSRVMQR